MKRALFALVASLFMLAAGPAFAGDKCKNVAIKFKNSTGTTAKVTKFRYYDYDKAKWRSETLTSLKINNNQTRTWTRNLEHVDNDSTKFEVTYKEQIGGSSWRGPYVTVTGKFTCKDNMSKTVTLK